MFTKEEQHRWIAERAYYLSQELGANPHDQLTHWLNAKADFNRGIRRLTLAGPPSELILTSDLDIKNELTEFYNLVRDIWNALDPIHEKIDYPPGSSKAKIGYFHTPYYSEAYKEVANGRVFCYLPWDYIEIAESIIATACTAGAVKVVIEIIKAWVQNRNGRKLRFVKDGVEFEIQGGMKSDEVERIINLFYKNFTAPKEAVLGLADSILEIQAKLYLWNQIHGNGRCFFSKHSFLLQGGTQVYPHASWVSLNNVGQRGGYYEVVSGSLCPDFVVFFLSEQNDLEGLKRILSECIQNGVKLGWLIEPLSKKIHVYRMGQDVRSYDNPSSISGDPILDGFSLDTKVIWG
jgi:Putative restriction endonuclease